MTKLKEIQFCTQGKYPWVFVAMGLTRKGEPFGILRLGKFARFKIIFSEPDLSIETANYNGKMYFPASSAKKEEALKILALARKYDRLDMAIQACKEVTA